MNYDPSTPGSSSYDFNQFSEESHRKEFDQQFAKAEAVGDNDARGKAKLSILIGILGFIFYIGAFVPILSWLICGITLFMAIVGIALATIALKTINKSRDKGGKGYAIAGLVLNIVQGVFSLIGVALVVMALIFASSVGLI